MQSRAHAPLLSYLSRCGLFKLIIREPGLQLRESLGSLRLVTGVTKGLVGLLEGARRYFRVFVRTATLRYDRAALA